MQVPLATPLITARLHIYSLGCYIEQGLPHSDCACSLRCVGTSRPTVPQVDASAQTHGLKGNP